MEVIRCLNSREKRSNTIHARITAVPRACQVIAKRSTDLSVGESGDLPRRADMCINEIYDSALVGEGCLPAFRHALANLLVSGLMTRPRSTSDGG